MCSSHHCMHVTVATVTIHIASGVFSPLRVRKSLFCGLTIFALEKIYAYAP